MIPVPDFGRLYLVMLIGLCCLLILMAWGVALTFSQSSREFLQTHRGWSALALVILSIPSLLFFAILYGLYQIKQDVKKDEQAAALDDRQAHVTLASPQNIAGIAMPQGSKLVLNKAIKPLQNAYFESAEFTQPVHWQGVDVLAIDRSLTSSYDEKTYEVKGLYWNNEVTLRLAKNTLIQGVPCSQQHAVQFKRINQIADATGKLKNLDLLPIDAKNPASADYRLYFCVLADAIQTKVQEQALAVTIPAGSEVFSDNGYRFTLGEHAQDFYTPVRWKIRTTDTSDFGLFSLGNAEIGLNEKMNLIEFKGKIASHTPQCQLPIGQTLMMDSDGKMFVTMAQTTGTQDLSCNGFKVEVITH